MEDSTITTIKAVRFMLNEAHKMLDGYEDVEDRPNGEGVRANWAMRTRRDIAAAIDHLDYVLGA